MTMEPQSPETAAAPAARRKIKLYDFKRPDKFSKDQTRVIQMMHESFARLLVTTLTAELRCVVDVRVASVDQLTYEEFIRSIPNPTVLARLDMAPLKGEAVLEIDPAISFAALDRLFGGSGETAGLGREPTSIECGVLSDLVARLLGDLREAWSTVIELEPSLGGIETNPRFAQIVPPTEMVVLVTLETAIGPARGMVNLCIPYLTIEEVVPKLSQKVYYSAIRRTTPGVEVEIADLAVDVEILYEGQRLTLGELTRLKRGSMVRIPEYGEGRAYLRAGGATLSRLQARRARGKPSAYELEGGGSALVLMRKRPRADREDGPDALALALRAASTEISAALKSVQSGIDALARRQEQLEDQLIFQSPDKEVATAAERSEPAAPLRPFDFAKRADSATLVSFLRAEHPQLVALVLSYLEPALSVQVLSGIPHEAQPDVVQRIAGMGKVSPETLHTVERLLEAQMKFALSTEYAMAGGLGAVVEILGVADRSLEKLVIGGLEKRDPELAEEVKRRMFVFEDIVLLDRQDTGTVIREAAEEDLLKAVKGVSDEVRAHVLSCMEAGAAESFRRTFAEMGAVRLKDVDAAQQRIVSLIRGMEEQGRVVINRLGEAGAPG